MSFGDLCALFEELAWDVYQELRMQSLRGSVQIGPSDAPISPAPWA